MGFLPDFWSRVLTLSWNSHTHQYITEQSILNVTLETLRGPEKHHEEEQVSSWLQSDIYCTFTENNNVTDLPFIFIQRD